MKRIIVAALAGIALVGITATAKQDGGTVPRPANYREHRAAVASASRDMRQAWRRATNALDIAVTAQNNLQSLSTTSITNNDWGSLKAYLRTANDAQVNLAKAIQKVADAVTNTLDLIEPVIKTEAP